MALHSLPETWKFVVLSLDPVATAENYENQELTEACRKLVGKKYVALVGDVGEPDSWV